jgi:glycosyltransferase involved in cell wall biosynthesis
MKKVLFITYDGLTDPLGQSQVLPYLEGLAALGHSITILSFEKKQRFISESKLVQEQVDKQGIKWMPLSFTVFPPLVSKAYDMWRMMNTARHICKTEGINLIHCRGYLSTDVGLRLKQRLGIPFVFDMRGFWADERKDTGHWPQTSFFYRRLYEHYKKKEQQFYIHADAIVSLTQAAKKEIISREGFANLNIEVIPCCAQLDHFNYETFSALDKDEIRATLNIPASYKVIAYLGSLGEFYMMKEMLSFVQVFMEQNPNTIFVIYTKDDISMIQPFINNFSDVEKNIRLKYVARKELPKYLSIVDYSIFFILPMYSKIASSPTKHAELMGMGIPVICNNIGDTGKIVEESHSGIVINSFANKDFQQAVMQLQQITFNKEAIRTACKQYFSLEDGIKKYHQLYESVNTINR